MLADGLGGFILAANIALGLRCFAIAVVVEAPVAALTWRLAWWRASGWVFLANICSAVAGFILASPMRMRGGPHVDADPWEAYQANWRVFLVQVAVFFVATIIIELAVYAGLNHLRNRQIPARRLVGGGVMGNVISYVVLAVVVFRLPPRSDDFQFQSNCDWVKSTQRVWFVDQDSKQLCSIRLDGTDRRTEFASELTRLDWYLEPLSVYAVVPEYDTILVLGEDEHWHCVRDGQDRTLSAGVSDANPMRYSIWPTLQNALGEVGITVGDNENAAPAVFFAAAERPWGVYAESAKYKVSTSIPWTVGPLGWGIRVEDTNGGAVLEFGVKTGLSSLSCRDPAITADEGLILFRCGGWLMVLDPVQRQVGRLVKGDSMLLETPAFRRRDSR